MSQLSEEEKRRCAKRAAFVLGHALVAYPRLPRREDLPEERRAVLGEALDSCVVDDYMTAGDMVAPLTIQLVASMYRDAGLLYLKGAPAVAAKILREAASIFSPLVFAASIIGSETLKALVDSWRRRGISLLEAFYALGLAALAAEGEVDGKTADLLLYAASFAVQEVAHPAAVLPILAALRPLGKKAPHRYVSLLATALELRTLGQKTVEYIYVALQKLQDRLLKTGRLWPLVEAIRAYSNLMRRRPGHIGGLWKEAVADMCELYSKIKGRDGTTAPESGHSAQRLFNTIAKAYVLAAALRGGDLAPLVQWHCGLDDLEEEAKDVMNELDEAAAHLDELRKIMESDADFAEWVTARNVTGDVGEVVEDLRSGFTYVLARYKLNHALDEKKMEEAAKEFEKAAEMRIKLEQWGGYLIARSLALRARVLAARSWQELLERAEDFQALWEEAKKHLKPTARYLATAALPLSEYLVYLAATGDKRGAEELLKKWRWLLKYDPRASVNARLMLRVLGVGDGARLKEVVDVFESSIWPEFQLALLMLAGRLQKDEALEICKQLPKPKPEVCVNAVAAATGDQEAVKRLKSKIGRKVPEASLLLDRVDGKTLVEVRAPKYPSAQLAFTLLATVEGRADAVRLHGLWGSAKSKEPLPRQLSRAVYENCVDLNREECRTALLKLYYYHV
jgi:tetratricopeptide (TPR) repeat protein